MLVVERENATAAFGPQAVVKSVCFSGATPQLAGMSLNSSEQMVFDYVQSHPEERHYWMDKVRTTLRQAGDEHVAATRLDLELWRYFEERSGVVPAFRERAGREGLRRLSMKNLAEYLLRVWTPPRVKKPALRSAE